MHMSTKRTRKTLTQWKQPCVSGLTQRTQRKNMNNQIGRITLFAVLILLLGSCAKDDGPQFFVDSSLKPYFERFEDEAALRNLHLNLDSMMISGDIRVINSQNVIGQCGHTEAEPSVVIVDKFYWDAASDLEREFVIFHELGHCALFKGHNDITDGQGNCVSIMTSGTGTCIINYNAGTRKALLDELFTR
jgi:hypothetical protein